MVSHVTGAQCTVLHADNPSVVNSEAFLAPLKDATGVWFTGGEPCRLAGAYLGTRMLSELLRVLDRGGVIGGNSAGAMIQASLIVHGAIANGGGRANITVPECHTGFGFFTNTAIDAHVDSHPREDYLADVLKAKPEILGLGIDNATSIIVHGDTSL
jgi:cyanophycinase